MFELNGVGVRIDRSIGSKKDIESIDLEISIDHAQNWLNRVFNIFFIFMNFLTYLIKSNRLVNRWVDWLNHLFKFENFNLDDL